MPITVNQAKYWARLLRSTGFNATSKGDSVQIDYGDGYPVKLSDYATYRESLYTIKGIKKGERR